MSLLVSRQCTPPVPSGKVSGVIDPFVNRYSVPEKQPERNKEDHGSSQNGADALCVVVKQ